MNKEELKNTVDEIIHISIDYEIAHSLEDKLHLKLIKEYCPKFVVEEIERLSNADFCRYCA